MPSRRQDIEFEAASEHLRRQSLIAWPVAALPPLALQVMTVDWRQDPEHIPFAVLIAAAAGGIATVAAVLLGLALRLTTRKRARVRIACRLAVVAGVGLVAASLIATSDSPRDALGLSEERLMWALVTGTLLLALGVANLPLAGRPGARAG